MRDIEGHVDGKNGFIDEFGLQRTITYSSMSSSQQIIGGVQPNLDPSVDHSEKNSSEGETGTKSVKGEKGANGKKEVKGEKGLKGEVSIPIRIGTRGDRAT